MKKKNKFLSIFLIITMLFTFIPNVHAAGSAKVSFSGSSTATTGSTVEVTLNVSNISNVPLGINAIGAKIIFDSEYLTYVKNTSLSTSPTSYAKTSSKIAFLSNSEDFNISENSGIIKFTFTAVKPGTTTIRTEGLEVADGKGGAVSVSDTSLTITISDPVPKSTNANLSSLSISGQTLSPSFDKNTLTYNVTVPHTVGSVTINATAEDPKAKSVSNTGSKTLKAAGQTSTFTVTCTAEDGVTKKNYVVNIAREAAPYVESSDNTLKSLGVDGYSISPAFNKNTLDYAVTIPHDATEVIINAEKNDSKAKVEITGNKDLQVGENTVTVKVTAENGSVKTYTVKVTRKEEDAPVVELDSDATLKSLSTNGYDLSPAFDKDTTVYSINVGENVTSLNFDAIPNSEKAKVEIKGNTGLEYGMNNVSIVVTAENGNKNTYIVNVHRKSPEVEVEKSSNNYLSSLSVASADIHPNFDRETSNYTITVPYDVSLLTINPVPEDSKAKVEIIGNGNLAVGKITTVQVKVTAEDGSVRIYSINAMRSSKISNTYLKELSATGFSLSPAFDKTVMNYTMEVKSNTKSLDLRAIASNSKAKVEILGNENFKEGKNTVLIKVTDENGFNRVYQIDVIKPEKTIFGLPVFQFFLWFFVIIALLALFFLLLALLKRKKKPEAVAPIVNQTINPTPTPTPIMPQTPIIEFKPEFNFGSKNGTDDDVVYGNFNQGNEIPMKEAPKKLIEEAYYHDTEDADIYDETVTKTELIEAIREGMQTKNPDKLKMLLKQDELNQLKKQVKEQEERKEKMRSDRYDDRY